MMNLIESKVFYNYSSRWLNLRNFFTLNHKSCLFICSILSAVKTQKKKKSEHQRSENKCNKIIMWLLLISRKLQISLCDFEKQNHFYDLKWKKKKKKKTNERKAHALSVLWGKHVTSILRYLRDGLKKEKRKKKKKGKKLKEGGIWNFIFIENLYKRCLFV